MNHKRNVENFLAGKEFSIPVNQLNSFYASLLETIEKMGLSVVEKVPDPILFVSALIDIGRESVLSRSENHLAERSLKFALRITRKVAPAADEIKTENLRLLAIILCRLCKFEEAQRCDIEAVLCARRAGLTP